MLRYLNEASKRRFNDATSAERRVTRWSAFGPPRSGKHANDTPDQGLVGHISEARPLALPAFVFLSVLARSGPCGAFLRASTCRNNLRCGAAAMEGKIELPPPIERCLISQPRCLRLVLRGHCPQLSCWPAMPVDLIGGAATTSSVLQQRCFFLVHE